MAGMRPPTLMLSADGAYCRLAVAPDAYPPRITGAQLVPLWKMLPAPTPANTETGPLSGPGFFGRARNAAHGRVVSSQPAARRGSGIPALQGITPLSCRSPTFRP